ncbi:FtsQ-type POTRA domain-containing protein [Lampropedia puyangensis]|uniref:Cell division protein FtsQ n=1 Tax=Lampropedia puyangensis TaxID=1330072 RepID=A0A4S8ESJ7_9BURK|nr:cell division protein FtsQ/DivIB [Lampropedia puyangensis]THT96464.1 FtsQ-type POTRA domain-containing protein [Lampropedia puyangensis]
MSQTAQPVDVRLMNATASLAFSGVFVLVCAAAVLWALRNPAFAITQVVVHGDPQHSSAVGLQANVLPQLKGNLFTLDLNATQKVFEQMPWVRKAELRRAFPNTLDVRLQEHVPVAMWDGDEASTMINTFGEVFEANRGEVEHEILPRLAGPDGQSASVLAMYRYLLEQLQGNAMQPVALYLTPRGNWQLFLSNGAHMELGAGEQDQVGQRLADFFTTLPQALAPLGVRPQALEFADLRHRDGYAIRLRGVVTQAANAAPAGRR